MRFFLPRVPNLSQKDSSLSPDLGVTGRGDLDRGDAISVVPANIFGVFASISATRTSSSDVNLVWRMATFATQPFFYTLLIANPFYSLTDLPTRPSVPTRIYTHTVTGQLTLDDFLASTTQNTNFEGVGHYNDTPN